MKSKIKLTHIFFIFFLSCNIKNSNTQGSSTDSLIKYNEYYFFHDKFLISSVVKPYEEDARNTVSELALTSFTDIKSYSFINMIKGGMMSITVAELKKPDSLNAANKLNELIEGIKNNQSFTVNFKNPIIINNNPVIGNYTSGKTYVKGKESSYMLLGVLTDNKTMMTIVAAYENANDEIIINHLLSSIKRKY